MKRNRYYSIFSISLRILFLLVLPGCSPVKVHDEASQLHESIPLKQPAGKMCYVSSVKVNFRQNPCVEGDECRIIETLEFGSPVKLTGSSQVSPEGIIFVSALSHDYSGWIAKSLIQCDEMGTPLPTKTPDWSPLVTWAYSPPSHEENMIRADLAKIKSSGANAVYISHSNPGEVDDYWPTEIGMTFSIWNALVGNQHETNGRAEEIFTRIKTTLRIAEELDIKVILAVGYQIEMGRTWNKKNPEALRRNPDGSEMKHWQDIPTASPYSSAYRYSISEYYKWVNKNLVLPFPHVVGLNLADEPMGSDFSQAAQDQFKKIYKKELLGNDGNNPWRGDFLRGVIADYATFSAETWKKLNPGVWVTMTFHFQRDLFWFPSIEKIFSQTPDNFVVSSDTHYHDAPPDQSTLHLGILHNLVKNLALYSKCYNKKIMLWSSANGWGLTPKGTADMAEENVRIVRDWTQRFGAKPLAHLFWGFNIPHQGLFGDAPEGIMRNQESIWNRTNKLTPGLYKAMSSTGAEIPNKIYLLSQARLMQKFGDEKTSHLAYPHLFNWGQKQGELQDSSAVIMVDGACADSINTAKEYLYQ